MISKFQSLFYLLNIIRYFNFYKIINFLKILFSYQISALLKKQLVYTQPYFISVETTDYCQLECPECPVGQQKRKSGTTFNLETYKSIIYQQKKTLLHVILYFQGEPLLNKQLSEFISIAHNNGIFTSTSTNAQLLNNNNAKTIVESGLDKIIISLDGATQDTYSSYRIGGKLDLAIKGIEYLNYWKKELNSKTPYIEIQFVVFKTNEHELATMKNLAKNLQVFRLSFKTAQLYNYENGHPLLTTIDKYARYKKNNEGKYIIKNKLPNRCFRLWSGAVITTKNQVLPCCFDKNAEHNFGTVNINDFSEIYNADYAKQFRNSVLYDRKQFEMCRNCSSK